MRWNLRPDACIDKRNVYKLTFYHYIAGYPRWARFVQYAFGDLNPMRRLTYKMRRGVSDFYSTISRASNHSKDLHVWKLRLQVRMIIAVACSRASPNWSEGCTNQASTKIRHESLRTSACQDTRHVYKLKLYYSLNGYPCFARFVAYACT